MGNHGKKTVVGSWYIWGMRRNEEEEKGIEEEEEKGVAVGFHTTVDSRANVFQRTS